MVFTKGTEYALKSIAYMGKQPDREFFGVRELAENLSVSASYLAKILQKLARDGFLKSVTGPGGGFGLNPGPRKVKLISIMETMEDRDFLEKCVLGWSVCGDKNPCPFHEKWKSFRAELMQDLKKSTVEDLSNLFWPDFNPTKSSVKNVNSAKSTKDNRVKKENMKGSASGRKRT